MKRLLMDNQQKKENTEVYYGVAVALVILLGVVIEGALWQKHYARGNSDCASISLALVQVEAVLFGLTISLIALLTGKMENSFLGIGHSDYLLNKRTRIFTQKTIIASLLVFLVLSFVLHMVRLYVLVFSFFLCSCILIWLSAVNVYRIFSGTFLLKDEIEAYFYSQIKQGMNARVELLENMVKDWEANVSTQPTIDYKQYQEAFFSLFRYMISNDKERALLSGACVHLSKTMLNDPSTCDRGLAFVVQCYQVAVSFVIQKKERVEQSTVPFHLFRESYDAITDVVRQMPIHGIEELLPWERLTEYVLTVNLNLGYDPEDSDGQVERYDLTRFGGLLGWRLAQFSDYRKEIWGEPLSKHMSGLLDSEDWENIGAGVIAIQKFWFVCEQIKNRKENLVKEYLFSRNWKYGKLDNEHAIMMLKVFCFLYYLAFYESQEYAGQELIDFSRELCASKESKEAFSRLVYALEEQDKNVSDFRCSIDVMNESLRHTMVTELRPFEILPVGQAKLIVMEDAVTDFVLFLFAYVAQRYSEPELMLQGLNGDAAYFYLRYIRTPDLRGQLKNFLSMDAKEANIDNDTVQDVYSVLEKGIRIYYKKSVMSAAEEIVKHEFSDASSVEHRIKDMLEKKFSAMLLRDYDGSLDPVELMKFTTGSERSLSEDLKGFEDDLFRMLLYAVCHKLKRNKRIRIVDREDGITDNDLLQKLRYAKDNQIIIGSEYAIKPQDHKRLGAFLELLEATEHSTCGGGREALFLRKGSAGIYIGDVLIEEHAQCLEELNKNDYAYDPETDLYTYEPSRGLAIELTKGELIWLLEKTRRVYTISVEIGLVIMDADQMIGEVIHR